MIGTGPTHGTAAVAVTIVASHAAGSQSRSREPPRNHARTSAPAVAGSAKNAGRVTQSSCSTTPYAVHATPLMVELASEATLTPAAERSRMSLRNCGTV